MALRWLLHQLSDSAFPTGGFVHSGGLEAAYQHGHLRGPAELRGFLADAVWQAGFGALPLLSEAHRTPGALAALDARAETFLVGHVARRASSTQGRAFLDTCARIFPEIEPLREEARAARLSYHHAPLFGATLRRLEVPLEEAQELFLSLSLRGLLSAAVRLGAAGTHQAQRLQRELAEELTAVLSRCGSLGVEDLAQTAPVLDLFSGTHDRLYSRLFQS